MVVPCFNEKKNIVRVLDDLDRIAADYQLRVVMVNDESSDGTRDAILADGRAVLLDLPANLGIGGAVQTGFRYAVAHGFDYAVKFDGDGQHPADKIGDLMGPLLDGRADFTIGSRFLDGVDGYKSTLTRRIGIRFFRALNSILIGQRITDNTSGFRAYNREALEFAAGSYPAFDYPEPEEVVLMGRNGFRIHEVPTPMRERMHGKSSINVGGSVYYMIKVFLAVALTAFRPVIRNKDKRGS